MHPAAPPPIIKYESDRETAPLTPVRGPRAEVQGPSLSNRCVWIASLAARTKDLGSGEVAGKVLIVDHM